MGMLLRGKKMDEDLISLIEQILGKDEKNISFKFKDFIPEIVFTFIPLVFEIVAVIMIKKKLFETISMIAFIISYAIQLIYVITGFICISKDFYKSQKVSAHSILQDFNKYKKTKSKIEKLIEKLNTSDPKLLFTFKEYLFLEKSKFDNRCSFLFVGVQNVGLFSLIFLFAKNIEELSKISTPLSTISIFTFVFPLVVSLFILFEKKKAYKLNQILIYLGESRLLS
jgi:hypothetical protein